MLDWLVKRLDLWAGARADRGLPRHPTPEQIAQARLVALRQGNWAELATRLPQFFRDGFVLETTAPPSVIELPPLQIAPAALPVERLGDLRGKQVFLRIARKSGAHEIVAARVDSVSGRKLKLDTYDPAEAQRLSRPGDSLWTFYTRREEVLTIHDGERVVTALVLPVAFTTTTGPAQRRVQIHAQAEQVLKGTYNPRVDLDNLDAYLARDPATGRPWLDDKANPIFRDEFVAAVKVEQNVFSMPIVHLIGERMIKIMRTSEVREKLLTLPLTDWDKAFNELVATPAAESVVAELRGQPRTPLGIALANFERLCAFSGELLPGVLDTEQRIDASKLLRGGALTASSSMVGLAVGAAHFAKKEAIPAPRLLRDSAPLTVRLASMPLGMFAMLHGPMVMPNTLPPESNFELVHAKGTVRLELNRTTLAAHAKNYGFSFDTILPGTTGCPAAHSLNGVNIANEFGKAFAELFEEWSARSERERQAG